MLGNAPFNLTGINTSTPTSFIIQILGSRLDGSDNDFFVIRPGLDLILPVGTSLNDYAIDIIEYGSSNSSSPHVYTGGVAFEDRTNPFWNFTSAVGLTLPGINDRRYDLSTGISFLAVQAYRDNVNGYIRPDPYVIELSFVYKPAAVVTPRISVVSLVATQSEGNSGFITYTFTVKRTGLISGASSVNWVLQGAGLNPAAAGDFAADTPLAGTIQFAANESEKIITVRVAGDTLYEQDEEFEILLTAASAGTDIIKASQLARISNDDAAPLPSITLAVAPASVTEDGSSNLIYTFTRSGATPSSLSVNYTVGGTATFGTDYSQSGAVSFTATSGTIVFAAGSATATLSVDPTVDSNSESDETVALTLAPGSGYTIGTTTAVSGTISNDDLPSITLAVAPASVTEDATANLIYTFSRTGPTTSALTVNYTVGGTANLGTDYAGIAATPVTKTVTFVAGSATATVTVDPATDTEFELDETVSLTLAAGSGYTIGTTTTVSGTISNDDAAPLPSITLAVAPASVMEDGSSNLIYTFTRSGATTSALTVNYTVAGTANLGTDYAGIAATPATKTVTFVAGSATVTVTVDPTTDTEIELDETVALTLAPGSGYTIGTTTAVSGTISNDDAAPLPGITLAVAPASVTEDGSANLTYTFTRTGPTTNPLTIN